MNYGVSRGFSRRMSDRVHTFFYVCLRLQCLFTVFVYVCSVCLCLQCLVVTVASVCECLARLQKRTDALKCRLRVWIRLANGSNAQNGI